MKMLTESTCKKSWANLSLCVGNTTETQVFKQLIKEHFELVEHAKKLQDKVDYYKHEYYSMCDLVENNEVKKCNDMTICQTLEAISELTQNDEVEKMLNYIEERVGAMEDRLLAYCNAIESLGFKRIGRDYENQ